MIREPDWMVGALVRVQCLQGNPNRVARELWDEVGLVVGVHHDNDPWDFRKKLVVMMCRDPSGTERRHFHPQDVQFVGTIDDTRT